MYYGEKLNSVSHLVGAVLALVGLGALLTVGVQSRDPWVITSFSVFGFSLVLLYTMSTLYHSFHPPKLKDLFQLLDHVAIYLLIAGTYTPIAVVVLRSAGGWWLLGAVWFMAIFGMVLDAVRRTGPRIGSILLYLAMGWICVLALDSLAVLMPRESLLLLIVGGFFYTSGIVFFVLDSWYPWCHGVWHLFVLAGSVSHYFAILLL